MPRRVLFATIFLLGFCSAAMAACPSVIAGSTPEAIAANAQRLICIQNEVAAASRQRQYQLDFNALDNRLQNLQLRQRFEALPAPYMPPASPGFAPGG